MGQAIGKDVGRKLPDAELANLLAAPRQILSVPLLADADKPMLLQSRRVHSLAVIDHDDGRVLVVEAWGEDHLDVAGARVEGVGYELLDGFVRASVEALREELDDSV